MRTLKEEIARLSGIILEDDEIQEEPDKTGSSYLAELKKLINGELVAEWQYELANKIIVGKESLSYLQNEFSDHAKEEHDHFDKLADALLQRGEKLDINLSDIIKNASPETEELSDVSTEYLNNFFIKAESNAIKDYQEFYDKIENVDKDLADIINGIIADERQHKYDLEKVK